MWPSSMNMITFLYFKTTCTEMHPFKAYILHLHYDELINIKEEVSAANVTPYHIKSYFISVEVVV